MLEKIINAINSIGDNTTSNIKDNQSESLDATSDSIKTSDRDSTKDDAIKSNTYSHESAAQVSVSQEDSAAEIAEVNDINVDEANLEKPIEFTQNDEENIAEKISAEIDHNVQDNNLNSTGDVEFTVNNVESNSNQLEPDTMYNEANLSASSPKLEIANADPTHNLYTNVNDTVVIDDTNELTTSSVPDSDDNCETSATDCNTGARTFAKGIAAGKPEEPINRVEVEAPRDVEPVERLNLVSGDDGNDFLQGSEQNDYIDGGKGNDVLYGNEGNDTISGGSGNDRAYGGDGDDTLLGGDGNDWLLGGAGDDVSLGGAGNDIIYDLAGDNTLDGGAGNDYVISGTGNDTLYGGSGHDMMNGGLGDDQAYGGSGNDRIYDYYGNNTADGGEGNDWVLTGFGNDNIQGGAGNDYLSSGGGNDTLDGGEGNDYLMGGAGNDTLHGGEGTDTLNGSIGDDVFIINSTAGSKTNIIGGANTGDWVDSIEMQGSNTSASDVLNGSSDWVMTLDSPVDYSIDGDAIVFDGNASGTLTNSDGAEVDFTNIDQISWL